MNSSKEQSLVINAEYKNHSPIVIIAGAWSWKTTTIINKIKQSIINDNINSHNICAISFTNKSAKEIKERIIKNIWNKWENIKVWTFHSISLNILKKYFWYKYGILDQDDEKSLFKKLYDKKYENVIKEIKDKYKNIDPELYEYYSKKISDYKTILWVISKAKNTWENVYDIAIKRIFFKQEHKEIIIPSIYIKYTEFLQEKKYEKESLDYIKTILLNDEYEWVFEKIDIINYKLAISLFKEFEDEKNKHKYKTFDDLLIDIVIYLSLDNNIRKQIDEDFKYVYVDEFQDVNFIQFKFLELINKNYNFLTVVWDSDQAIYSFRWCDKHYFNNFNKYYPNTRIFYLNDNYRSDWFIVNATNNCIKHNEHRYVKVMNNIKEFKNNINILEDYYEKDMYSNKIIPHIFKLKEKWEKLWEIAILYRNNNNSYSIQKELLKNKIPFNVVGWINFFSKKHIKDIRSFLENLNNLSKIHLERILKLIPKVWNKKIEKILFEIEELSDEKEKINILAKHKEIQPLYLLLFNYRNKNQDINNTLHIFVNDILSIDIEKEKEIQKAIQNKEDVDSFLSIIQELLLEDISINEILEMLAIDDTIDKKNKYTDKVILSTIHRSKWLEWNNVFVIKAYEWIFPSSRVKINPWKNNFLLEEERNLFYVAITRARNNLFIWFSEEESYNSFWENKKYSPSRFIWELEIENDPLYY